MRRRGGIFRILFLALLSLGVASGCSTLRPANVSRRGVIQSWVNPSRFSRKTESSLSPRIKKDRSGSGASVPLNKEVEPPEVARDRPRVQTRVRFRWPLDEVQVTSRFGQRNGDPHDGLDLRAMTGTPVRAIADGKVLYADRKIRGYGRMVILRHDQGWSSVYAHGSRLKVRPGQRVLRGQIVALSGASGRVTGPHLHFEVRYGTRAVDPERFLPAPPVAGSALSQSGRTSGSRRVASSR